MKIFLVCEFPVLLRFCLRTCVLVALTENILDRRKTNKAASCKDLRMLTSSTLLIGDGINAVRYLLDGVGKIRCIMKQLKVQNVSKQYSYEKVTNNKNCLGNERVGKMYSKTTPGYKYRDT